MGNMPTSVPLLDVSSSGSSQSPSLSETSLGEIDETAIIIPVAPSTSLSAPTGCLSFCWSSTSMTKHPPLLVINTDVLDDDENADHDKQDESADFGFRSCSPKESGSHTGHTNSLFRSRSTSMSSLLSMNSTDPFAYTEDELALSEDVIVPESDCSNKDFWIVTTAALPWFTGTAVNPLLRAAHLCAYNEKHYPERETTLVVPWLEDAQDRTALYGMDWNEATPNQQEDYIRNWLLNEANMPNVSTLLRIHFYPARYHVSLQSIFAMGDLCERLQVRDPARSICILEEPEHVNFYRAPGLVSWRSKFPHVSFY
jgi:hypothetical protein